MKTEIKVMPKTARKPPEAKREARNRFSAQPSEETSPADPESQTSSLQNGEAICFYSSKSPRIWYFAIAALGN